MKKNQFLATGNPEENRLADKAKDEVQSSGMESEIETVTDINKILDYDVIIIPTMIIDGKIMVVD
jgi:hypothetical protein